MGMYKIKKTTRNVRSSLQNAYNSLSPAFKKKPSHARAWYRKTGPLVMRLGDRRNIHNTFFAVSSTVTPRPLTNF